MQDLIDTCHNTHYFNYRSSKLRSLGRRDSILPSDDMFESKIDASRKNFKENMAKKEEEMRQHFFLKVKEKEAALRQQEENLIQKEQELMGQIEEQKRQLEAEERELELSTQRSAAGKKNKGYF